MEQVTMPQLGETVVEGTVTRWLKAEGDEVSADEPLFEVSTDKVDTEVPSAHRGVVRSLLVAEGDTVPVGTVVALVGTADEPLPEAGPRASSARPAPAAPLAPVEGWGATGAAPLSPIVRRLLDEHGLDPVEVRGSGRDGRITRADVLAVATQRVRPGASRAPTSAMEPAAAEAAPGPGQPVVPGPDDDVVPFTSARRATAEHMRRSLETSAHAFVAVEVDFARVEPERRRAGLSYLPFVARAVVDSLGEFRLLNSSVGDDCLVVHPDVHLGVAVDLDGEALLVPVVRHAADLRLEALAAALGGVAERARARRLGLYEVAGATFTITNVGSQGTLLAMPIIDQPQVAILSTDGVRPHPVARTGADGEWAVTVHPVGNLSLSFDHRAVDGAYAAAFLNLVRTTLEERDWAQEL